MAPDEIDLTARTRSARVLRAVGSVLVALFAAGCLASFLAGPEALPLRLVAGAVAVLVVLGLALAVAARRWTPRRLVVDHEGIRVLDGRGRRLVRLAWTELSGVGVMTNQEALSRKRLGVGVHRWIRSVSIWLELHPADAAAVARHPELARAWALGSGPGEEPRWLVRIGDTLGQEFPIGAAVQRRRPGLWRGHRSGAVSYSGLAGRLLRLDQGRARAQARGLPFRP